MYSKCLGYNTSCLSTQLERCTAYAERHGYLVVGKLGGTYESAKSDERKEFQKILEFVKKSKLRVGYIIVYSHYRFSRTDSSAIGIVDKLGRMGISVVAVTQPVDKQTASGKLQQGIQFLFSQFITTYAGKSAGQEWERVFDVGYGLVRC